MEFVLWRFDSHWTRFDDLVSTWSLQQLFAPISRLVSRLSKFLEIHTVSMLCAKPGLMANNLLFLALPSCRRLWLLPMSMIWLWPNYWSRSPASQDLVQPFTPRMPMNASKPSWMPSAIDGMRFLNVGHSIPEASRLYCNLQDCE